MKTATLSVGNRGFTLIELIVVLVIAASMTALVPPLISRLIPSTELKATARNMAAGLRMARNLAINQKEEVVFLVDVQQRYFTLQAPNKKHRRYAIPDTIEIKLFIAETEMTSPHAGGMRFFPQGGSTGGRIGLKISKRAFQIDVDWLTGRVKIDQVDPYEL